MRLENIIKLLKISNSDSEYIRIAKGRNEYPSNLRDMYRKIKMGAYSKNNKV